MFDFKKLKRQMRFHAVKGTASSIIERFSKDKEESETETNSNLPEVTATLNSDFPPLKLSKGDLVVFDADAKIVGFYKKM